MEGRYVRIALMTEVPELDPLRLNTLGTRHKVVVPREEKSSNYVRGTTSMSTLYLKLGTPYPNSHLP